MAQELVDLRPDVIVVNILNGALYLHSITQTIPIVAVLPFAAPKFLLDAGIIKSQAHPGGNFTGLLGSPPTLAGKRLDLLHEVLPQATRLAILGGAAAQPIEIYKPYPAWTSQVVSLIVSGPEELDGVFARFEEEHTELLVVDARGLSALIDQTAAQARRRRLPSVCDLDTFVASGGLMSYAADLPALFRGAARFVDKILKGTSPADLPVELPTTFNFIINKGTADGLGLTIPPAVLAQATEVLQ